MMSDPVIRRLQCAACLYFEVADDGFSLARVIVDVPIPALPLAEETIQEINEAASEALARWMGGGESEPPTPAAPDPGPWPPSTSNGAGEVAA
jgi:hypothetical protein